MNHDETEANRYVTPDKKITFVEPKTPYKKKLRRYKVVRRDKKEKDSDLMLFDSTKKYFQRYAVFLDHEIGIDSASQQKLVNSEMD